MNEFTRSKFFEAPTFFLCKEMNVLRKKKKDPKTENNGARFRLGTTLHSPETFPEYVSFADF